MPEEVFERVSQIVRSDKDPDNVISGHLATNGEASDGHILNIRGGKLPKSPPLLFGHDDYTGRSNLGSWTSLKKEVAGDKLGQQILSGRAKVEVKAGEGEQLAFRKDVLAMVQANHIRQFSIRWAHDSDPVLRTSLSSEHPAYLDEDKARGSQRWGLYFDKWRMLEGSVVTLGADPEAIIGRMRNASSTSNRRSWGRGLADMVKAGETPPELQPLIDDLSTVLECLRDMGVVDFDVLLRILRSDVDPSTLLPVEDGEGRRLLLPEWAFKAIVRQAIPWVSRTVESLEDTSITTTLEETKVEVEPEVPGTPQADTRTDSAVTPDENSSVIPDATEISAIISRVNIRGEQRTKELVQKSFLALVRGES